MYWYIYVSCFLVEDYTSDLELWGCTRNRKNKRAIWRLRMGWLICWKLYWSSGAAHFCEVSTLFCGRHITIFLFIFIVFFYSTSLLHNTLFNSTSATWESMNRINFKCCTSQFFYCFITHSLHSTSSIRKYLTSGFTCAIMATLPFNLRAHTYM